MNRLKLKLGFILKIRNDIYDIVGYPVEDSSDYKSLSQMIRVYAGINSRSADINPNKTFYAQKITHVRFFC